MVLLIGGIGVSIETYWVWRAGRITSGGALRGFLLTPSSP